MGVQARGDCVHGDVPEGLGVAWLCGLLWEDVSPSIGVSFLQTGWFLISLPPAILEITTSPMKTKNQPNSSVLSIFSTDVLEALFSL